ncbi:hypothetical protein ACLB1O_29795 [Escherichia coli]
MWKVLLILEIALEERRAFTIAMQFFCGTFSSTTSKEYLSVDTVIFDGAAPRIFRACASGICDHIGW